MKQFRVTVRFRMAWSHFDSSLTDYIMNRLKNEMAQHIDKLEIERVEPQSEEVKSDLPEV